MAFALGVIGLGRIAQALLNPLFERGDLSPENVIGVVGRKKSIQGALDQLPPGICVVSSDDPHSEKVWGAPIQLLAVKPQQLSGIEVKETKEKSLLISLLAGVTLKRLEDMFPGCDCVRAVPNTPVMVQEGLTGLSWNKNLSSDQCSQVKSIFNPISEVIELPETQLDAFLALTSSGPAYIAVIAEALADGAVAAGLPRVLANHLSHRTLAGTASLLQQKGLHPGQLKDMVASPGGTTIAALRHLEMAGVRSALIEAVVAAAERSRELA